MSGSGDVFAEGTGYRLRALALEDVASLAAFSEDESYWRFLSHGPRDREQVSSFIERAISFSPDETGAEYWWTVVDPETDNLIGTANLKRLGPAEDRFGSAGCALAPDAQGRRLGVTLGWTMIKLAFDHFELTKVECTCAQQNDRSVYLMRDVIGLTYEGLRTTETDYLGRPWPVHVFSFTESEFRSAKSPVE